MGNSRLNLAQNEYIVYEREEADVLYKEEEIELFITNLNILIVNESKPLFKKPVVDIIKLPIDTIKVIDNVPQVTVELNEYDYWNIVILFNNGIKKLGIYYGSSRNKNNVKKEVDLLAERISQLRMTGTIILKQNPVVTEEQNESKVTNIKKTIKQSFFGKKIASGANYIKEVVKPQEKVQEKVMQEDVIIEGVEKQAETIKNASVENEFNFCSSCGSKKNKTDKFCPTCGAPQSL